MGNPVHLILALIVLGAVMYLVENYIPMSDPFKIVLRVVVVIVLIVYLLKFLGISTGF